MKIMAACIYFSSFLEYLTKQPCLGEHTPFPTLTLSSLGLIQKGTVSSQQVGLSLWGNCAVHITFLLTFYPCPIQRAS